VTVLAVCLLAAAGAAAAPEPKPAASVRGRIARAVARAAAHPALRQATFAVDVRSLATGKSIYARQAEISLAPASVLKVVTSAAALDAFGPERRFKTTLQSLGRQDPPGQLKGDLFLVGGGDPSLSRELQTRPEFGVLDLMAESLATAGVRRIEGRVVACDGLFSSERRGHGWGWEDLVWWYGAEVSALTFADGAANLKLKPAAAPGPLLEIERHPPSDYYRVDSTATTCAAGVEPELKMDRALGGNTITIRGCVPAGTPPLERFIALEDPALYAATVFGEALRARGIEVGRGVAKEPAPPEGASVLATYEGAPLAEILKDVNKPSHNLRAEMLLRLVGQSVKGTGSAEAGRDAVLAFLTAQGVDTRGWDIDDGSGLSHGNLVTARGLADLLVAMHRHPHAAAFRDSLPVAGVDGTLKHRFGRSRARGRLYAKTGTLRHICGLAGYAIPPRGEGLAFVILANHVTLPASEAQEVIDLIAAALVGS
jgi:D-alanyl-D-alanine carboxypeptidase/D-alanyl-D-alanine-endopeptidase (penicillin-binding protein 4)